MNKLIIICGGDRLGKGTLIRNLCEYYNYKNISIRHCDKPSKNISKNEILDYQIKCFNTEFKFILNTLNLPKKFQYHDNKIIYDRFYLGEYVYGHLFRNYDSKLLKDTILSLDKKFLKYIYTWSNIYLITLTADPEFFLSKEDGNSFSKNLEEKSKELELFKEVHKLSLIKNKLLLKVDKNGQFRDKKEIFKEVLTFINNKKQ